jgi:transmembrane sensor
MDPMTLRRYREASEWLLRLKEADSSDSDAERWLSWCEADERNLEAFERLQHDWDDLEGLRGAPQLITSNANRSRLLRYGFTAWAHSTRHAPAAAWTMAAAVAAMVVLGYEYWSPLPRASQMMATAKQEPTTLPDGSSLLLSAKAAADVDFTGVNRDVALQPGGEAYIKVHHDKTRPFVVRAGAVTVTAVGTAFDVRRDAGHVTVTVEEGAVELGAPGPNGPTQWRAAAGSQVDYSEQARTAVVSSVDPRAVLRWRYGELAYDGTPLQTVIADINRYSTFHLEIRDREVEQLRFTGTVFLASIPDWLKALEAKYPVASHEVDDGIIALQASPSTAGIAKR